jgi:hypothetical protein
MYLFTRRIRARSGGVNDAVAWASAITEKVRQITGLDVSLSASVFGPQVGTLVWSTPVPDLATLETAFDKLNVDATFVDEANKGQQYAPDGPDDRLLQFVFPDADTLAAGPPADAPQWQYASVVSSVCADGALRKGIELGVQIAQKATEVSGVPTAFLMDTTGAYGGVNWISTAPDIQTVEAANAAINASEEFLKLVDEGAKGTYIAGPESTQQLIYRRIV